MKESLNKRNSSIELLRIICIILIIMYHYSMHANYGVFNVSSLSFDVIVLQIFKMFGKTACHVFMIITGYFMIKSKPNYRKIFLLILEMMFYSIGIMIIFYSFGLIEFNIKDFIESLFPIFYGNWFIVNYIILCLFIPYINIMIEKLEKNNFRNLIILSIIIYSIIPTFTGKAWQLSNLDNFIVMYFVGAYIRKYMDKDLNIKFNRICMIISILLLISSVLVLDLISKILNIDALVEKATYFGNQYSILTIIAAIFMFLVFKDIKFECNFINWISSSTLGIYLIHDNNMIRQFLWNKLFPNVDYLNSNYFLLHVFLKTILIFIVCLIIDKIRIFLEKPIKKAVDNYYQKNNKFKS